MLKKINQKDVTDYKNRIEPTVYIVYDSWINGLVCHFDVGFRSEELGNVCIKIGGDYGFDDCYMLVKQEKDGIISMYAYKYDHEIYAESMKKMFKAAMQTWHTQEEISEMEKNNQRIYVEDIAIDTINKIIENGRICEIDEYEFDAHKNLKFECDYYDKKIIWDL